MKRLTSATAIGMILAATPALAEVTPKSVWENLNSYYARYGMTVETAAVDEAGDTLTVNDLVLSRQSDGVATRMDIGDVVFSATGDGAVRMDLAEDMTVTVDLPVPDEAEGAANDATDAAQAPADAEAADTEMGDADMAADAPDAPRKITLNAKIANEDITIREDGDAIVYAYMLPKLDVVVSQIELISGEVIENPVNITIASLKGSDRIEGTETQKVVQAASADSITFDLDVTGDDGEYGKGQIALTGVAMNSDTTLPAGGATVTENLSAMLKAGMTVKGDLKIAGMSGNLDMLTKDQEGQDRPVAVTFEGADSALNVTIDQNRIVYGGSSGATNGEMTVPEMPVPVGYGVGSTSFNLDVPVAVAEQAQNFAVTYKLDGLTLTDSVWGLFDPTAALPRDPASIDVDLAGSLKVLRDFFDPAAMDLAATMEDPNLTDEQRRAMIEEIMAPPADLRDITINKVALDVMGAKADVTGKLAAPEDGDMQTPVGTITGRFEGTGALLDKLGAAGLIPAEQMMGIKMMMQMFGKADAENPEVLTTELEFNEQGQVFANGQQVK